MDMSIAQAFTIFLATMRREGETRLCWTLIGLLIRICQGMGLHRDGSQFSFSPFDIEMRRRLWWLIVVLDARVSEELGTDMMIDDDSFDTQLPSNINDTDISPKSKSIPPPRVGPTDCAVSVVRYEIAKMGRKFLSRKSPLLSCHLSKVGSTGIAEREDTLFQMYRYADRTFLKHLANLTEPLYRMVLMLFQ